MKYIKELIDFLDKLEGNKIYYKLGKVRENTIMVEIAVPGERWEIEFNSYGTEHECDVEIEKFKGDGTIGDENELAKLFELFSE